MPPSRDAAAKARCCHGGAELSVSAWDAAVALEALDALLAMHGRAINAQGHRIGADHGPPAEEAA